MLLLEVFIPSTGARLLLGCVFKTSSVYQDKVKSMLFIVSAWSVTDSYDCLGLSS